MGVKKISVFVLVCLLSAFIISPGASMAAKATAASSGNAGNGATGGLTGIQITIGLAALAVLLGIVIVVLDDDDPGAAPVHGPSH